MLRSLALISLASGSLFLAACSDDNTKINYPQPLPPDMASDGTGGNGGSGGGGGGGGTGGVGGGGGGGTTSMDMGPSLPDLAGLPAPDHDPTAHPPLPTMTTFSAHSTISAPEIWTVVWKGDETLGDKVNTFNTWMLGSDYWKNGVKDYGVGAGAAKGKLVISTAPPATITDATLQSLVTSNVGKNGWPTPNANTIFSFVLDPKTVVTQGGQPASCVQFDGYHSLTQTTGVPYLVNAYCNDASGNPDWDDLTVTMSHEAAEASVDYDLGHNKVVNSSTKVPYLGGGENGDLCLSLNATIAADATTSYVVQRLWSNSVAVANNADPCVPVDDNTKWFGAGLVSGNTDPAIINVTRNAQSKSGSQTFKIEAWEMDPSFGPIGFYIIGSLLPAGVTITPNIAINTDANGNQTGAVAYLNAGGTFNGTVNVSSAYVPDGQPITVLIISRNETKTHYNIWWGVLLIK